MKLSRLGSFHQSKLSFSRSFLNEFKDWNYNRDLFDLDEKGYGRAVYSFSKNNRTYSLVCFANKINDDEIVILSTMLYQMYDDEEDENLSKHLKNYSIYDNTNINEGDIIRYKNMITIEDDGESEENDGESEDEDVQVPVEEIIEDSGVIEQKVANEPKPKEKKPKEKKPKKNDNTIK